MGAINTLLRSHINLPTSVANVWIDGRCNRQDKQENEEYGYGEGWPKTLEEDAGECKPQRLQAEGDESEYAVQSSLQLVWNQGYAVAELHNIIDWTKQCYAGKDYG